MRLWLLPLLLAAGCGGGDFSSQASNCTPSEQRECACPGGVKGTQTCAQDGSGFGECTCTDDYRTTCKLDSPTLDCSGLGLTYICPPNYKNQHCQQAHNGETCCQG